MLIPKYATLLLGRNCKFPVDKVHFKTGQVTLQEKEKMFNTVSIKDVIFDFSGFSEKDKNMFMSMFND